MPALAAIRDAAHHVWAAEVVHDDLQVTVCKELVSSWLDQLVMLGSLQWWHDHQSMLTHNVIVVKALAWSHLLNQCSSSNAVTEKDRVTSLCVQ